MLYFGYGSNLNAQHWDNWCATRGAARLEPLTVATLPDSTLAFTRFAQSWGGGVLDLRPQPGSQVHGVLFSADEAAWDLLDIKEGCGFAYRREMVTVNRKGEAPVSCRTYVVIDPEPFVEPSDAYLDVVAAGLRAHGLSTDALHQAASEPAE